MNPIRDLAGIIRIRRGGDLIAVGAASLVVAVAALTAFVRPAATHPTASGCSARVARATANTFLKAFNRGDSRQLRRLFALRGFQAYSVQGGPGARIGAAARKRSSLLSYFSARHAAAERLTLTWLGAIVRKGGTARIRFAVVRAADGLQPALAYRGTGTARCEPRHQLTGWWMAPNSEPPRPTPATYADTCTFAGASWCEDSPTPGGVPASLRRPLHFPTVHPGEACPTTAPRPFVGPNFGGSAFGPGPVAPNIASGWVHAEGVHFYTYDGGWYFVKTIWFSTPDYHGPVLIRGRQLDGSHKIVMGEGYDMLDPQLGPGATLNGPAGWREWPGGTYLRTPGCYAWQIDGADFSDVVVFEAIFPYKSAIRAA